MGWRSWLAVCFALVLIACGMSTEVPEDDHEDAVSAEEVIEGDGTEERLVTEETVVTEEDPAEEEGPAEGEDPGPLQIATLLPIESGTHEDRHWLKWKLGEPIGDPVEEYIKTYQLNIRSLEDDLFGIGYTLSQGAEAVASGFCLEDRPNCGSDVFDVEVEVNEARDEILFWVPPGTFGNATGLDVEGFLIDFPTAESNPENTHLGSAPMSLEEADPC